VNYPFKKKNVILRADHEKVLWGTKNGSSMSSLQKQKLLEPLFLRVKLSSTQGQIMDLANGAVPSKLIPTSHPVVNNLKNSVRSPK